MKKLILSILSLILAFSAFGQQLPNDPNVKVGRLDNGLTYYIRHNDKPAGRAEFHLATNAGAILETPDQDGLAHFLEHMCFNGTKNLPGKQMLEYLQRIGAEFGRNINAGTGVEQTTYMLNNMPVAREGIIDTCLLIMHDYSHFVTCDPVEIDKERGVIIEEKRSRNNASWRMHEKSLPYYYGDSKYATCTLIGSEENLKTFKPESLTNFYETWYRPDLQAVIVVGDIDVDQIEQKIIKLFSDIPAVENPTPKPVHPIPGNEEPLIGILTDKEATSTSMEVIWKFPARDEALNSTFQGSVYDLLDTYIYIIMAERLGDISSRPDAPFIGASLAIGNLCETCLVTMGNVSSKDGEAVTAFKALMTEIEKMKRYGFNAAEISRATDNILRAYEKAVEAADTRKNAEFVKMYINHFFDNAAYMEPQTEYDVAKTICSQITPEMLNEYAAGLISDNNMVVVYRAPEKEGLVHPTESDILTAIAEVRSSDIQANKAEELNTSLLDESLLPGSVIKKEKAGIYGSTEWTLKNGVKVVVLPTEYKKDQVIISLSKKGGKSIIATEDLPSFEDNIYTLFERNSGLAGFSSTELGKMLAGKSAGVGVSLSNYKHGISASCSPKDLETAFQLMYLKFVEPRFDNDEYMLGIQQISAVLPNLLKQPKFVFQNEMSKSLYGDNPRNIDISEEIMAKASLETIKRVYTQQLFKDAAGAVVYIIGNVDLNTLKPLVEKYIGSLPKGKKAGNWENSMPQILDGYIVNDFRTEMTTPMMTVLQVWHGEMPYSIRNAVLCNAASYILDMIYTDTLREEEGGTYGASASISLRRIPTAKVIAQVSFNTNVEQSDKLRELAIEGLHKLATEGPTEEQLTRTIENFKKNLPESRISNGYWLGNLQNWYEYGENYDVLYEKALNEITAENIKSVLQQMLASGNFAEVVMGPEM